MQANQQQARVAFSRRYFLYLAGSAASITALATCAAPISKPAVNASTIPATIPATIPDAESQEVIFWGRDQHPLDLAAKGFTAEYPQIIWVSPHPANHAQKITAALAAGSGLPDLYWAEATQAQDWGCNALLTDLTDQLKPEIAHYHPAKLAETFIAKHGRYVGWPGGLGVSGWYYRADRLQATGFGGVDLDALTWPDFLSMAAELKQQGLYSFCLPARGRVALFFFALYQYGGSAVSQDGQTITVDDEAGVQAMRLAKQLWESGSGLDVGWQTPAYWAALKAGQLIGDFASCWAKDAWEANLQGAEAIGALGNGRVAQFPGGDNIQYRTGIEGGAQLVSPKAAANTENAITFMRYALGTLAGTTRCGAGGMIPAYGPYLESAAFLAQRSPLFGDWAFGQFWAAQAQELSPEYFRPTGYAAVEAAVGQEMMPILMDEYSLEDGMSRIVELATPDFKRSRCA